MRGSPLLALALLLGVRPAPAFDLQQKSVSVSRQFIVYCDDTNARARIADFAEETKKNLLALLGQADRWKLPVVLKVVRASAANPSAVTNRVQLCQTEEGGKVELDVCLGADPREVRFEQQVVRALLLELAYREHPPEAGASYTEPPAWLIEGAVENFHAHAGDTNPQLFKNLLTNDHLPRLTDFLAQSDADLDATSQQFYDACAMSLVQLLVGLPDGRAALYALTRDLPRAEDDPAGLLIRHFPALGATTPSLEKWWALGVARIAASDRYQGLSLAETEQRLAPMLSFEIPIDKAGTKQKFALDEFEEFYKLPAGRSALRGLSANLLALSTEASALFRPVVADYQQIAAALARGKTHGVKEKLVEVAKYRELLLTRIDQIADYLNWFEATQETVKSESFDSYMKTAHAQAHDENQRDDAISRYLNIVQKQME